MLLIGLLLVAAVCLIVGLIIANAPLLIVSLVASVMAAGLLVRLWRRQAPAIAVAVPASATAAVPALATTRTPATVAAGGPSTVATAEVDGNTTGGNGDTGQSGDRNGGHGDEHAHHEADDRLGDAADDVDAVHVDDTTADPADGDEAADDDERDVTAGAVATANFEVLVIDGRPDYHLAGCERLSGGSDEAIPIGQALEDGFAACEVCMPPTTVRDSADGREPETSAGGGPTAVATGEEVVAATNGVTTNGVTTRSRVAMAPPVESTPVETPPITTDAAATDAAATDAAATDAAATDVAATETAATETAATETAATEMAATETASADISIWVVDGSPEYHRADCSQLAGRDSEPIPLGQATEDGFVACEICRPPVLAEGGAATPAALSPESPAAAGEAWVVDGYPDYHAAGCVELTGLAAEPIPLQQAIEDEFQPCAVCGGSAGAGGATVPAGHAQVWVVDGYPDFHLRSCERIARLDAEPIPFAQAGEDGFAECETCRPVVALHLDEPTVLEETAALEGTAALDAPTPTAAESAVVTQSVTQSVVIEPDTPVDAGPVAMPMDDEVAVDSELSEVWVVDGRPEYHRSDCAELVGQPGEPIPTAQAVEDGFAPCTVCTPDAAAAPAEPVAASDSPAAGVSASAGLSADVWVVDGRPDYHLGGCAALDASTGEQVPRTQAVEDGFQPCELCRPDVTPGETVEVPAVATPAADEDSAQEHEVLVAQAETETPIEAEAAAALAEPVMAPEPVAVAAEPEPRAEPVAVEPPPVEPPPVEPPPVETVTSVEDPAPSSPTIAEPVAAPSVAAGPEPVEASRSVSATPPTQPLVVATGPVWVVEGRPRFHEKDCLIIKGQRARSLTREEAEQQGMRPCSLCQR